jgi:hypothetical protein
MTDRVTMVWQEHQNSTLSTSNPDSGDLIIMPTDASTWTIQ